MLGIASICCFLGFWLFAFVAAALVVDAVTSASTSPGALASIGFVGMLSLFSVFAGFVTGLLGVILKNHNKVVAGIGLGLNLLLVIMMVAR